jgi:hypothetical protein
MSKNQPTRKPIIVKDLDGNVLHRFISKRACKLALNIDANQLTYILEKKKRGPVYKGMVFSYGS